MKFFLLTFFFGFSALAVSFTGTVRRTGSELRFVDDSDKKSYRLEAGTPLVASYLNRVNDGDFLSVDGTKSYRDVSVTVGSISYVGLTRLLGTWYGDDSYCYNFTSYTEFSITQRLGDKCLATAKPDYTYLISPDSDSWVIIISAQHGGNYIGDVSFVGAQEAQIQLYDPETGDILRYVHLRK